MATVFTRDPEVENAAVNLLRMSVDDVLRARIPDLKERVKDFIVRNHREGADGLEPPRRHATQRDRDALAASEIGLLEPAAPSAGIRQVMCTIPEGDEDMKGMEFLLTPIDVNARAKEADGLSGLSKHIYKVLEVATDLEQAAREKRKIVDMDAAVLDSDDIQCVTESIQADARQLVIIYKWLSAVLDDLAQLIRARMVVEDKFQQIHRGSCVKLCQKIRVRSLKLKALHSAVQARLECLQIPRMIEASEEDGSSAV